MPMWRLVCIAVVIAADVFCRVYITKTIHPAAFYRAPVAEAVDESPAARLEAAFAALAPRIRSQSGAAFAAMSGARFFHPPATLEPRLALEAASGLPSPGARSSGVLAPSEPKLVLATAFGTPSSGALALGVLGALTSKLSSRFQPAPALPKLAALETEGNDQTGSIPRGPIEQSDGSTLKGKLSYLVYYVYAEIPPDPKPADVVKAALKDVPVGTPLEEIRRASDAFGLDFNFMRTVAKIESDFDPKQRTGSYIGLFQLSRYEFARYGSGEITNSRDNAIAAAYKFVTEAALFEWDTHKKPTFSDLYLIHQQGWQGAAQHVAHPQRIAWKSMCATDEGMEKGEAWCKRAIWKNTLPAIKEIWKSVEKLTSAGFVDMWRHRVDVLYARYAEAGADEKKR